MIKYSFYLRWLVGSDLWNSIASLPYLSWFISRMLPENHRFSSKWEEKEKLQIRWYSYKTRYNQLKMKYRVNFGQTFEHFYHTGSECEPTRLSSEIRTALYDIGHGTLLVLAEMATCQLQEELEAEGRWEYRERVVGTPSSTKVKDESLFQKTSQAQVTQPRLASPSCHYFDMHVGRVHWHTKG